MSAWMLPALILIPLLSAAVVGYFRNAWPKATISWVASGSVFVTFLITLGFLLQFLSGNHQTVTFQMPNMAPLLPTWGFMMDSLSLWWMLVVTGCGFLIHLYSNGYMVDDPSYGRFMAKMNYFIFAMSLLVISDNFAGLLMGWANVGLASYMLIGFYIKKPSASSAAMKAFVMNMIGEVGMIAGIAFIYMTYGTLNFAEVFGRVQNGMGLEMLNLIGVLLLIGAIAKSAQFPLHTWLPHAMEGPTPVSALIHAATMVTAGVYLVSRAWPIYMAAESASLMVAWIGGIGALMGAVIAAGQNDIKRVLAFSTMSQIGYMFLGNGLGAYVAADFHFFTHAFFKAALFLTAGIVVHHYHGDQDIRKMGGLWQRDKFAGYAFGIGALALIGIPPFAGFWSKDEILLAAYHHNTALFVVGIMAAFMTAFYNVRLFSLVFFGQPYTEQVKALGKRQASATRRTAAHDHGHGQGAQAHSHHDHGTPITQKIAVGTLVALSVVGGLIALPHWQFSFLESAYVGSGMEVEKIDWAIAAVVTLIGLMGAGLSWYLFGPKGVRRMAELNPLAKPGPLVRMLYFDEIYDLTVVQPVKVVSDFFSVVGDGRIIDGTIHGLAGAARSLGEQFRAAQTGQIRRYALYLFGGVAAMLVYFIAYV